MLGSLTKLEVKIGERIYQFICAVDSPLGEAHDALSSMKSFIVQKINELEQMSNPKKEEDLREEN